MAKLLLVFILSTLLLSACGYSVDQLAEDDDKRRAILQECVELGAAAKDEKKCEVAAKAELEAAKRAMNKMMEK